MKNCLETCFHLFAISNKNVKKNKNKGDVLDRNKTIHKGKTKESGGSLQKPTITTDKTKQEDCLDRSQQ